ncbi:MAG: aminotransferase class III-fold pyridoxal phosphate-dependent enzyme [Alphaproteobacteria bacterium]|nr:aminotransferase class III-fold pyridoxal phosphate-dependent enzyme [Alphaproteobacteria bacterium]
MTTAKEYILFPWGKQTEIELKPITRAKGIYFWDQQNRYFDMASQCVNVNIGHGDEDVINAIKKQCDVLPYAYSNFSEPARIEAAKKIIEVAPKLMRKVFFTNSGAESNENAIKIARMYTKRHKIFSAYQSYHGATLGAGNLTGDARRFACEPGLPGFVKFSYPHRYRSQIHFDTDAEMSRYFLHILREQILFEGPDNVAAIFVEPIIGGNGVIIPPDGYLQGIRVLCDEYGILMVSDEVMTGWGRTGAMFAIEHWGGSPDMITVSKGVTSSYFPLGAVLVNERIAKHFDQNALNCGSTHFAHPIGCAAASACIGVYQQKDLVNNSVAMGNLLYEKLLELKEKHQTIGDVRGKGLFSAIEFVENRSTKEPLKDLGPVMNLLKEKGFWTQNRRHILIVAPPLIISREELKESLFILDEVLTQLNL